MSGRDLSLLWDRSNFLSLSQVQRMLGGKAEREKEVRREREEVKEWSGEVEGGGEGEGGNGGVGVREVEGWRGEGDEG